MTHPMRLRGLSFAEYLPRKENLVFAANFDARFDSWYGGQPTIARASNLVAPGGPSSTSLQTYSSGSPGCPTWPYKNAAARGGVYVGRAVKNWILQSEAPATTWSAVLTPTVTNSAVQGPDGVALSAGTIVADANNEGITQSSGVAAVSKMVCFSAWVRVGTGTLGGTIRIAGTGGTPETTDQAFTATTTWQRVFVYKLFSGAATGNATATIICNIGTLEVWGMQVEINSTYFVQKFPGAYVKTTAAVAVSESDLVTCPITTSWVKGTLSFWHYPTWAVSGSQSDDASAVRNVCISSGAVLNFCAYVDAQINNTLMRFYFGSVLMGTMDAVAVGLAKDTWGMFVVTWDNSGANINYKVYWGAASAPTQRVTNTAATPTTPSFTSLYLGHNSSPSDRFGGDQGFGRVRVWSDVLATADWTAVYNAEKGYYGF